jgi:hypothetical protein
VSKYLLDTPPPSPNRFHAKQFGWTSRCAHRLSRRIAPPLFSVIRTSRRDPGPRADKLHLLWSRSAARSVRTSSARSLCATSKHRSDTGEANKSAAKLPCVFAKVERARAMLRIMYNTISFICSRDEGKESQVRDHPSKTEKHRTLREQSSQGCTPTEQRRRASQRVRPALG